MREHRGLLIALAVILIVPLLLRTDSAPLEKADDRLVIITPHNEATRYEFTRAFTRWYREKTGRTVALDWRNPGGASEIARTIASEYRNAFRREWERRGERWDAAIEAGFDAPWIDPEGSDPAAAARKAFLGSEVSSGIDLYFGGGSYDLIQQSRAGRLVPSGVLERFPELFGPEGSLPPVWRGEPLYDPEGRWIGTALAAFGICYNEDALWRVGFPGVPTAWRDLADPRLAGATALADPTQSGSAAKAFEMVIQQEIAEAGGDVTAGWAEGVRLIRRMAANARYFTDSASKVPWDVAAGDAAAGMAIDFYGRSQSEAVRRPDGSSRMSYVTPEGGSSFGADPIGLLRGAPSPKVAREFIAFALSPEGQQLWNQKAGTPGGPERYALRRLPIRPDLYTAASAALRSDPEVNPFAEGGMEYHPEATARLFRVIGLIVRTACIETHPELRTAWAELIRAGFPSEATAVFDRIDGLTYHEADTEIRPLLSAGQKIDEVRLVRQLCDRFREQYREAARLAREGR